MNDRDVTRLLQLADEPQTPSKEFVDALWADLQDILEADDSSLERPLSISSATVTHAGSDTPNNSTPEKQRSTWSGPRRALAVAVTILIVGSTPILIQELLSPASDATSTGNPSPTEDPTTISTPALDSDADDAMSARALTVLAQWCQYQPVRLTTLAGLSDTASEEPTPSNMVPQRLEEARNNLELLAEDIGDDGVSDKLRRAARLLLLANERFLDGDYERADSNLTVALDVLVELERQAALTGCFVTP